MLCLVGIIQDACVSGHGNLLLAVAQLESQEIFNEVFQCRSR